MSGVNVRRPFARDSEGIYHRAVRIGDGPLVPLEGCEVEYLREVAPPFDPAYRHLCPHCILNPPREKVS